MASKANPYDTHPCGIPGFEYVSCSQYALLIRDAMRRGELLHVEYYIHMARAHEQIGYIACALKALRK